MASRTLDREIDRLYQLPLDEFTPARNGLAKDAGADAARIRALTKPPIAAWAVNQLYWRNVDVWNALIEAAENARRTHKAVLSGRAGDVRAATKVHDDAVEEALRATLAMLANSNHPASDATKHAIATTLRALPGDEPPGRLTRVLQPGGFEMLTGLSMAPGVAVRPAKPARPAATRTTRTAETLPSTPKVDAKALTRAREASAAATRGLREAEHAVRREEFEIVRTTRDEERAAKAVEDARKALIEATSALERAEAAAKAATRVREAVAKRSEQAREELSKARSRAESAAADLKKIERTASAPRR
jgi:hypothetical protein